MNQFYDKAKTMTLPPLPWTHQALGEDVYCKIATELGYFNPKAERKDYRPDLDPSPYLSLIKPTTTKEK